MACSGYGSYLIKKYPGDYTSAHDRQNKGPSGPGAETLSCKSA
ncbi:hypothetical protein [Olivibacter domesticus]|uniref:Uncharacterized protein n=1 Tax=Olivibacter domesticus TaxID=407022 RepID=A0A1H7KT63_OLID1|nr:hypothetical protein [Olivibacter domesticus]SEK90001.1 hypothetical protein SAMN05661044_01457 [Olivibacter domesticus]